MLTVLIGKTCSGKTSIADALTRRGYKKVVTYTSRPKRKGEKDGVDYHFISKEEFLQGIEAGFFMEYKTYQVPNDEWYYGTSYDSLEKADDEDNYVIILTPKGYTDFLENCNIRHRSFYIYANHKTILHRLKVRKDTNDSIQRRMEHDDKDFKMAEYLVDKVVYNNNDDCLREVVEKIMGYMEK